MWRISKAKSIINKYKWEGTNYLSGEDDWKKLEKKNPIIALNVLYSKKINIFLVYISKNNSNHEKQIIFKFFYDSKQWRMALSCSKIFICVIRRNNTKTQWWLLSFVVWTVFIPWERKKRTNLNCIKKYVKLKIFVVL